jgi:hypothetical protein
MNSKQDEYRYLLLWWGENALDWERKAWQLVQESNAFSEIEIFLEANTREEFGTTHSQLIADSWQLTGTGSGAMRRVSTYRKLRSAE